MPEAQIQARFRHRFPDFVLDLDLELPSRGVTAVFGPSGCGKTTLLRAIAGLLQTQEGYFSLNGEVWQDATNFVPPHRRPLGYVFQEASLFAHLTVQANVDYGRKRSPQALGNTELARLRELLGINSLLARKPGELSGGERQRVAIVRALAVGPRLLLMDEPLASLDLKRKQEILPYLERLREELDMPILYVSHAPNEVARLADHLVVLEAGAVLAQGPLKQVLADVSTPIRLGEDAGSVLEGKVVEHDARWHLARVAFPGGALWVRDEGHEIGARVRLRVLARDVGLSLTEPADTSILNHLEVRVEAIGQDFHPALALARLAIEGQSLVARLTCRSVDALGLAPGKAVWALVKAVAVIA